MKIQMFAFENEIDTNETEIENFHSCVQSGL